MRVGFFSLLGSVALVVSQAHADTTVSGTRTSSARNDLIRSGCKQVGDRFDCTTIAAKEKARAYLAAGEIADYTGDTFTAGDKYTAPANKFTATTTHDVTLVARQQNRALGSASGEVTYSVEFDVVRWDKAPRSQCNPSCSALPRTKCARKTEQQDAVRVPLNGPAGGLFSIAKSELGAPITGKFSPTDDDLYRAWDACERANAWGNTTSIPLRYRVSALFHIDNWKTKAEPHGCSATNVAALVAPTVDVTVPVTVTCEARPRAVANPRSPSPPR